MTERLRSVIVGADATAFHIFNAMYRDDEKTEVAMFFDINISGPPLTVSAYPSSLAGKLYPTGIPIVRDVKIKNFLVENRIRKCIFSPHCLTKSLYLNLAAQCIAAKCGVITHPLDSSRIVPKKPLVSFYSDSQFTWPVLDRILKIYQSQKIAASVCMPCDTNMITEQGNISIKSYADLHSIQSKIPPHVRIICENLLLRKMPINFIIDYKKFDAETEANNLTDLYLFVGFNSLPCFFQSHHVIYLCDEYTFGFTRQEFEQHPSSIIMKHSNIVILIKFSENKLVDFFKGTRDHRIFVELQGSYSVSALPYSGNRRCLLIDDPYPTQVCNATSSISYVIARKLQLEPIEIPSMREVANIGPIFYEPSERDWPAVIVPHNPSDISESIEGLKGYYDAILSTSSIPISISSEVPVCSVSFDIKVDEITADMLELPPGVIVKRR